MKKVFYLNKELFNAHYDVVQMNNNSIVIKDCDGNYIYVHRKVLNAICRSTERLPCTIMDREYCGETTQWLATMFTL